MSHREFTLLCSCEGKTHSAEQGGNRGDLGFDRQQETTPGARTARSKQSGEGDEPSVMAT